MMLSKKIEDDIAMIVESLGFELYDIEYSTKKLVIYIDRKEGITIGDCELVSKNVGAFLDVEDPIAHSYTLEVSSPGINRKLRKKEHFDAAVGKPCLIKTYTEVESLRVIKGVLKESKDDSVVVRIDAGDVEIKLDNIKSARIDEEIF